MSKPINNPPNAAERALEQAMAQPTATEPERVRANAEIERRIFRRFHAVNLRKMMTRRFRLWDVWFTNSRERWYRDFRRAPGMKYKTVVKHMASRLRNLGPAHLTLWNWHRNRLHSRIENLRRAYHEPFGAPPHLLRVQNVSPGFRWFPWKVLTNQGAQGAVLLCLSLNTNETIDDRSVLKSAERTGLGLVHPHNEIHFHRQASIHGPGYVVGFRDSLNILAHERYFILMDYCPYGGKTSPFRLFKSWD